MDQRSTGNGVIGDVPWGTHLCLFYANEEELAEVALPFVKAGLEHDELCVWVTPTSLGTRAAWERLAAAVPELDAQRARGRIEIVPHTLWYLHGGTLDPARVLAGWLDKLKAALARGCAGLRLMGNASWLETSDWARFSELEAALDVEIASRRMLALCAYGKDRCGVGEVADVIANHGLALIKRRGAWERLESRQCADARVTRERQELDRCVEERTAELREREEHFRALAEALPQIVWTAGSDGGVEWFNQRWYQYTGQPAPVGAGWSWAEVAHPDDMPRTLRSWAEARRRGSLFQNEIRVRGRDGEYRWFLVRAWPLKDGQGNIVRWFGTNTDFHEMKEVEADLRRTREDLDRAQEVGQIGWWRLDTQRNVLSWSDESYRIFGVPRGSPQSYDSFLGIVHPDDRDYVDTRWKAGLRGEPYDIEHRIVADGRVKWVREKAYLELSPDGTLLGGFGISQDITDRRQAEDALRRSEERWNAAIENFGEGAIIATEAEQVIYWNPAARAMHGYTAPDEGIGPLAETPNTFELWTPDGSHQLTLDEWPMRRIKRGETVRQLELRLRRPDQGWERIVSYSGAMVETASGERLIFLSVYDLTERRRAEADLREANEAKDLFFNTLSHELRTPLAAMQNALDVVKKPEADEAQRAKMLAILERNIRHQTRLIDDLLDLSRIMRGKVEIARDPLDLREIASSLVDAAEPAARKSRLALSLELPERPIRVTGDVVRLGQVISNLLTNAIKYTEEGGSITVAVRAAAADAVLVVRDTGIGMSAELLAHLFEPFRQGEVSLARSTGGLGVGLAIARSLAELHGGRLEAASAGVGLGSEFTLRLPLRDGDDAHLAVPSAQEEGSRAQRVLVIEDNPDLRESLALLLQLMGHTVICRENGSRGVECARAEKPDVVLVDIGLPDMDGYEVARRLRADASTQEIRLIALTGYATPEHRDRALLAGFDHHLAKPVGADALQQVLDGGAQGPAPR